MIRIDKIATIIESKYNINSTWLYKLPTEDRTKESRIEIRIKEVIGDKLSIKKRNAVTKCLTKTFMNHVKKIKPSSDFVSLTQYVKNHTSFHIRVSDIKKLLAEMDYLVDDFPTGKAYRYNYVFTKFIDYQIIGCKRSKEVLKLWKSSFLDNLIKRNIDKLSVIRRTYSFTRPRTKKEGMNCINNTLSILAQENPNLPIDSYLSYRDNLYNLLSCNLPTERAKNQVKYLFRHVLFMDTHYR